MSNVTNSQEAMKKVWSALDDSPFVMVGLEGQRAHYEPMTAQFDDDLPNRMFFYTRKDNRLIEGLSAGQRNTMVVYQSKSHNLFCCMRGEISIVRDDAIVDRFWSNGIAAWFEGGRKDPSLTMLQVNLRHAEIWLADIPLTGKMKMVFGGDIDTRKLQDKHFEARL